MADILPMKIPLPIPRPEMEELIPGRVERQINELHDIWSDSMSHVWSDQTKAGLELMKEQWNNMINYLTINAYDFAKNVEDFGIFLVVMLFVGASVFLIAEGISYFVKNIWDE